MKAASYRFGAFELRLAERRLLMGERVLPVSARAFDVLVVLASRAGELVSNQEMLAAVWPGLVVEENNVQVQVSQLRRLIGPASIVTVSGRGYRLALPCLPFVPGATSDSVPSRAAPPRARTLYGRDEELADLDEMLGTRALVSLLGTSGVGKTALAAAVARRVRERFADGVCWVDLSDAAAQGVVPVVCAALDLPAGTGAERLAAHLAGRHMLLVLDNADRVSGAAADLAALLLDRTAAHLLVTTQVRLNLPEENVYRLATLAVPTAGTPLAAARAYGALAMLEARIAALDHHFQLDDDNLHGAIRLCRKLDGLPLALELAAARVPALGIRALLAHLDDGMTLLSGGSAGAPSRHRSLHAALEWSYGLLGPAEQRLYRQLAALPQWFGPAQLAGTGPVPPRQLDSLTTLVDRGLVTFDAARAAGYTLGETGRVFAAAKRRQALGPL